jgi:hypothetical protein
MSRSRDSFLTITKGIRQSLATVMSNCGKACESFAVYVQKQKSSAVEATGGFSTKVWLERLPGFTWRICGNLGDYMNLISSTMPAPKCGEHT